MSPLVAARLRARARTAGGGPLLTYYDVGSGERTELSATSFLNWVDKTSNLLLDELLLGPGARVALRLAGTAPGHWVTWVLVAAVWQVGGTVVVSGEGDPTGQDRPDLTVVGPDDLDHLPAAPEVLACSLHPLGLGFVAPLPAGVTDYALEVRSQPDSHSPVALDPGLTAWVGPGTRLTQADLVALPGSAERRLLRPTDAWATVRNGLVAPVLGGGSTVLVTGGEADELQRIGLQERARPA